MPSSLHYQRWLKICALLTLPLGCTSAQPLSVSTVPLGLGPLAVAEQEQDRAKEATRVASAPKVQQPPDSLDSDDDPESDDDWIDGQESGEQDDATEAQSEEGEQAESGSVSESGDADAEIAAFEGLFAGEDIATFRFPGQTKQRQEDPNAKIRIELGDFPTIRIVLINSDTGDDLCTLLAKVERRESRGASARLRSGQPCFTAKGSALSAVVTSGRAVIRGDQLTVKARGDLELTGADEVQSGTLRYSFSGGRQ